MTTHIPSMSAGADSSNEASEYWERWNMNKAYLNTIRAGSCYPTFRAFVTVATVLAYIVAALVVVAGFVSGQGGGVLVGIVVAVVIVLIAKVGQEVSLMIADIADATIDSAGHRNEPAPSQVTPRSESLHRQSPGGSSAKGMNPHAEALATEVPSGPMGVCPNCKSVIPLASETCKKCRASFGPGSAWKVKPAP